MFYRSFTWLWVVLSCTLLCACQGTSPVFDTVASAWSPPERNPQFSKNFEYLQVEFGGRKAYMALGSREVVGVDVREYWYSGQREMLQLLNGRIEQVYGMTREVRQVSLSRPTWTHVLEQTQPLLWERHLDLMPGYRYGVSELLTTTKTTRPIRVPEDVAPSVIWVKEGVQRQEPEGRITHYSQSFAIDQGQVVYSEQCLAADMCFKLKPLGFSRR